MCIVDDCVYVSVFWDEWRGWRAEVRLSKKMSLQDRGYGDFAGRAAVQVTVPSKACKEKQTALD